MPLLCGCIWMSVAGFQFNQNRLCRISGNIIRIVFRIPHTSPKFHSGRCVAVLSIRLRQHNTRTLHGINATGYTCVFCACAFLFGTNVCISTRTVRYGAGRARIRIIVLFIAAECAAHAKRNCTSAPAANTRTQYLLTIVRDMGRGIQQQNKQRKRTQTRM